MSIEASAEKTQEEQAAWPKSSWLQRRYRRLVIGAVVSGVVLSGVVRVLLHRRRKP